MNVTNISPATAEAHCGLRSDFIQYAETIGFTYCDYGIEHKSHPKALKVLGSIQDNTALYLRGSPDAWIAHPQHGIAVQVEFKSRQGKYDNMALEAQPLASAIQRSKPPLNIRVLYAYRDSIVGRDVGFWCSNPPVIADLYLGGKDSGIHRYVQRCFPDASVESADAANGSRDSFVRVMKHEWTKLPHWSDLLDELVFGW